MTSPPSNRCSLGRKGLYILSALISACTPQQKSQTHLLQDLFSVGHGVKVANEVGLCLVKASGRL